MDEQRAIADAQRRTPGLAVTLRRWPLPGDAPFAAFAGAIDSPDAALAPGNAGARRIVSGLDAVPADALARALGEAAERYSACYFDPTGETRSTAHALGADSVPAEQLLQTSARQRAFAAQAPAAGMDVPPTLDPERPICWLRADAAASTRASWVPAALVRLGHPDRHLARALHADSSGLAHADDAATAHLRAALEIVERDAVAIWWRNRLRRPPLRFRETDFVAAVRAWLWRADRNLTFIDLAHDLGVPVAAAIATRRDGTQPVVGTGAGATREAAAGGALREMLLGLLNMERLVATARVRGPSAFDPATAERVAWHRAETTDAAPWLVPDDAAPPAPPLAEAGGYAALRARLEEAGLTVLAFDLTRPGAAGAVCRVIVPGLRSTRARFAPGRLFDVPVALGWRRRPLAEAALNETACPA